MATFTISKCENKDKSVHFTFENKNTGKSIVKAFTSKNGKRRELYLSNKLGGRFTKKSLKVGENEKTLIKVAKNNSYEGNNNLDSAWEPYDRITVQMYCGINFKLIAEKSFTSGSVIWRITKSKKTPPPISEIAPRLIAPKKRKPQHLSSRLPRNLFPTKEKKDDYQRSGDDPTKEKKRPRNDPESSPGSQPDYQYDSIMLDPVKLELAKKRLKTKIAMIEEIEELALQFKEKVKNCKQQIGF